MSAAPSSPKEDLEYFETARLGAAHNLLSDGYVKPLALCFFDTGVHVVMPESFDNGADKQRFVQSVRATTAAYDATHVVFLSEAWSLATKIKEGQTAESAADETNAWLKENGSLEKHPDRIEVIIVTCESYAGVTSAEYKISRVGGQPFITDTPEYPITFTPREEMRAKLAGRFMNLLPPEAMRGNPIIKELAKKVLKAMGAELMTEEELKEKYAEAFEEKENKVNKRDLQ